MQTTLIASGKEPLPAGSAIYLDNNATTRVAPEVVAAMLPFFLDQYGNASSRHSFGDSVLQAIRTARRQVQRLIGAGSEDEIIFTSGGTESDSTALHAALKSQPERRKIITTAVEHQAVLAPCEQYRKEGYEVHLLPLDGDGRIDMQAYHNLVDDRTALVSVMWANNETGRLFPVAEMAALARARGVVFHTDAVQAIGKIPVTVEDTAIDMLSLSGHKLHAPKGIGALYLRRGSRFRPLLRGGHQENGRRAGTENAPAIVGLGKAAEMAFDHLTEIARIGGLRDRLEQALLAQIPGSMVVGTGGDRLPNTATLAFEHLPSEVLLPQLNRAGIAASSGAACSSGSVEPSHVLRALRIPASYARGAVRFSLSRYTTDDDIGRVIATVPRLIAELRAQSFAWRDGSNRQEPAAIEGIDHVSWT